MNKMLVFDLDGTLLDENRRITQEAKEFLRLKKEEGYKMVIATGRVLYSALDVTDGAEFSDYIITDTGSAIYDTFSREPIFIKTIPKNIVGKFFEYYNEKFRYIDICNKYYIYKYSDEVENSNIVITLKDKDRILSEVDNVTHVSITMYENDDVEKLYNGLVLDFPELNILIMQDSFEESKWIEIQPKECTKYNAIVRLANYLNISNDNIIAFGDGLNDIEMIEKCGVGVAMNNALDEVKKVSNCVTKKANTENGVIEFLKEYLNEEEII